MKRKAKRQKKILIISVIVLFISLTAGYSAFNTNIKLKAKGSIVETSEKCFTVIDNGDGTGTIEDYDKLCGTKVKIPNKINGLTITKLADIPVDASTTQGFVRKGITHVWFPDTLTYIGDMQFFHNNITEINIPDSVTYIGQQTFSGNKIKGELKLPSRIKTIENVAFYGNDITKVNIPNTVTYLGSGAFTRNSLTGEDKYIYGINKDGSIDYTTLNSYASKDTDNIKIPKNVELIENWAFGGMTIKYIEIPSNVKTLGGGAFSMTDLASIKLNDGLEYIGDRCFAASTLTEITIPASVQAIQETAFTNSNLKTINIKQKENKISGSPWEASNAQINWLG